ncbi:hypothetical protein M9H77_28123 [Catharanthus roseus]|uniref:Uncharacterized protein n=1 Tax=Catharanthus roseus TaxID=4058 RepID=A0ACC0AGB6_CATRO|nr:hypothetical protein M9H77_28123 [Catharanthus roseus]
MAAGENSDESRETRCRVAAMLYELRRGVADPNLNNDKGHWCPLSLSISLFLSALSNTPSKRSSDDPRKPTVTGSQRTEESSRRSREEEEKKSREKPTVKRQRRMNFKRKRKWMHKKRGERGY